MRASSAKGPTLFAESFPETEVAEGGAPKCGKGWGERCAISTGTRCHCSCGGKNHGGLRTDAAHRSLHLTPTDIFQYRLGEQRVIPSHILAPDDRVIECVRVEEPDGDHRHAVARVFLDRNPLPRRIVHHSPTGFEWGYGGSGPADLALNILTLVIPPKEAWHFHQDFKSAMIATLPQETGGKIALADVRAWLDRAYRTETEAAA